MHEGVGGHGGHGGHEGEHDAMTTRVSLSISILAVLLAIATMLGHRTANEGAQKQMEAFDQWAFYQAKNGRQFTAQKTLELESVIMTVDKEKSEKFTEKTKEEIAKYEEEKKEISGEAKKLQGERDLFARKLDKYELGESLLEIAIVLCSVALITKRSLMWYLGLLIAAGGIYFAAAGYLLH